MEGEEAVMVGDCLRSEDGADARSLRKWETTNTTTWHGPKACQVVCPVLGTLKLARQRSVCSTFSLLRRQAARLPPTRRTSEDRRDAFYVSVPVFPVDSSTCLCKLRCRIYLTYTTHWSLLSPQKTLTGTRGRRRTSITELVPLVIPPPAKTIASSLILCTWISHVLRVSSKCQPISID